MKHDIVSTAFVAYCFTYGTAQLQGNIHTHPECMQDASRMLERHVQNVHEMH